MPALARRLAPLFACLALLAGAQPGQAEEDSARMELGGDLYVAGEAPGLGGGPVEDLFAAGQSLRPDLEVTGSAHLAGRRVSVRGPVGGNLYAAGQDVRVEAPVGGDATLAGYDVVVAAPVAGDLRAGASSIVVDSDVGGALLAAGERVEINAVVAGDARIRAEDLRFGPGARIEGELVLIAPEDVASPPASVVPPERLERRAAQGWGPEGWSLWSVFGAVASALFGVTLLILAIQAALVAVAPRWSEEMAFDAADSPFRCLGAGFAALAALIGAVPLVAVTVIGAPLAPLILLAAVAAALGGYALGAWALGMTIWRWLDRAPPFGFWKRFGIAALGLALAAGLGMIPVLGWMLGVALTLAGLGAAAIDALGLRPSPIR